MFSQIKDVGTADRRLDGKTMNAKKEHLPILTPYEECSIVELIKNKNRCHQSFSRKQVGDLIVNVLKIRDYCNSKYCGGYKFVKW